MKHIQARVTDEEYRDLVILGLDKGMKLQELFKLALRALVETERGRKTAVETNKEQQK